VPITITEVLALDIPFPTSDALDGSDAMDKAPNYAAAYVTLMTDHPDGLESQGISRHGDEVLAVLLLAASSGCRSAPTQAMSGAASMSSTGRSSTTSP